MTETRRIGTGMTEGYASEWSMPEAIREVIQNYLDVRKETGCGGRIGHKDGRARVRDRGDGLRMKHLAMGISEKPEGSIGQFGEGLKLALLVMAREGRNPHLLTGDLSIRPLLAWSEDYGVETLQFEVSGSPRHTEGTSMNFDCTREELDEAKGYFTHFLTHGGDLEWLDRDNISLPGGWVYVNGSRIAELNDARFSYHLGSEASDLINRDRGAVNETKIAKLVSRIILDTSSTKVMRRILLDVTSGTRTWEVSATNPHLSLSRKRRRIWVRVWNQAMGDGWVLPQEGANRQAEYKGFKILHDVPGWWGMFLRELGVETAGMAIRVPARRATMSVSDLTDEQRENLEWAIEMVTEHYAEPREVTIVEDVASISGSRMDVLGAWDGGRGITYLKQGLLDDREGTLHTLLHETVHAESGASDLTARFEHALLDVAVRMIRREE